MRRYRQIQAETERLKQKKERSRLQIQARRQMRRYRQIQAETERLKQKKEKQVTDTGHKIKTYAMMHAGIYSNKLR